MKIEKNLLEYLNTTFSLHFQFNGVSQDFKSEFISRGGCTVYFTSKCTILKFLYTLTLGPSLFT